MPTINKPKRKNYGNDKAAYKKRQKVYQSKMWKDLRLAKLMEQPLCYVCELEGKTRLADDLHHLVTFTRTTDENEMNALAYDSNNIVPLCKHHHWAIHNDWLKGARSLEEIEQYTKAHIEKEKENKPL